jgi:hypothetical protein
MTGWIVFEIFHLDAVVNWGNQNSAIEKRFF